MNGFRSKHEPTPAGRLAALARAIVEHFAKLFGRAPDIADFREEMKHAVERELILARLEELRLPAWQRDERRRELVRRLMEFEIE